MLTDEVAAVSGMNANMTRLIATLTLFAAATACTADKAGRSQASTPLLAATPAISVPQFPMLFIVDGVKFQRDQLALLTDDRIFAVRVLKGRAALERYGQDASYGVVLITTRQAAIPRA